MWRIGMKPEDSKYKAVYCDIVHRCNMECANCYLPFRDYADLDTDKVIDFIKRFKVKTELDLLKKEPTLHKDLAKIIKEATALGHRTPSSLKNNNEEYNYLKELKDAGLKTVYLSMTGFDDDEVYIVTDRLKCGLPNLSLIIDISLKLRLSIGCIVIKGLNEHIIDKIVGVKERYPWRAGTSFEFRNVGQVGRYMVDKDDNYKFDELKQLISKKFDIGSNPKLLENNQYAWTVKHGKFRINITNWKVLMVDLMNKQMKRGELTSEEYVNAFLEHIKENDGGY